MGPLIELLAEDYKTSLLSMHKDAQEQRSRKTDAEQGALHRVSIDHVLERFQLEAIDADVA